MEHISKYLDKYKDFRINKGDKDDKAFRKDQGKNRGMLVRHAKHEALEKAKHLKVKHEGGERKLEAFHIYNVGKGGKETHEKSKFL